MHNRTMTKNNDLQAVRLGDHCYFDCKCYTELPGGIESVHPRFAISWRKDWPLRQTDFVVTYITHTWGGAYKFAEKASKQRKTIINPI